MVAAPAPSLEMFSPTILRQSVSLEPSALLTASLDVQPEPSALTGSVDEAPSRLLRFEDSDFAEQPLKGALRSCKCGALGFVYRFIGPRGDAVRPDVVAARDD